MAKSTAFIGTKTFSAEPLEPPPYTVEWIALWLYNWAGGRYKKSWDKFYASNMSVMANLNNRKWFKWERCKLRLAARFYWWVAMFATRELHAWRPQQANWLRLMWSMSASVVQQLHEDSIMRVIVNFKMEQDDETKQEDGST